jgi:RNA polymerase primary sigma factor
MRAASGVCASTSAHAIARAQCGARATPGRCVAAHHRHHRRSGLARAPARGVGVAMMRRGACVARAASALRGDSDGDFSDPRGAKARGAGKASTTTSVKATIATVAGGVTTKAASRTTRRTRAIADARESSSMSDEDLSAALGGLDLNDLEALTAKVSQMMSREGHAMDAGRRPTAEELARLESSVAEFDGVDGVDVDDDDAFPIAANGVRGKSSSAYDVLTPKTPQSKRVKSARATTGTTRRRAPASGVSSEDESSMEVAENGVVTDGLAQRSARARAVARGVRSRPAKASVTSMVHTQAKERVRGVHLSPRKMANLAQQQKLRVGTTDSMRSYLKDIGSVTLLNAGQEVELAKRIQDLMHLESIKTNLEEESGPGASISDYQWASAAGLSEHALNQRLRDGKAAKNEMIQANLRLVVSIAKKYANSNMSFQDLIQEGCVGLIRGAEKFDFQRGYKFSTYAHWWIRQAVTRSISDQSRTIRLPVHLFEIISRISKMEQKFSLIHGRDPTIEEIAAEMEMSAEKIVQIKKASQAPVSLAQSVGSDDSRTVEDTLVDINGEGPEKVSGKSLLKEDLENVLNTLNPRERDVLRLRYGLDDGRIKTLEEIGTVFSVTRERIRQIEAKALRKLKQPSRNSILADYFSSGEGTLQ